MKTTIRFRFLIACFALIAAAQAQAQNTALRAAFVEGADVMVFIDGKTMNASGFAKAVKAQQTPEMKAEKDAKAEAFTRATGLKEDDVKAFVFSMDLDGIDFEANDPEQMEKAKAVLAVELEKAVTLEQVKAGLVAMSDESETAPKIEIGKLDGLDVVILGAQEESTGPDKAFGTLSPDGKTVLMAFNTASLRSGLERIAAEKTSAPSDDMAAAIKSMGNRQARMALVLPQAARAKIAEGIQAGAAEGGMGMMFAPFAGLKTVLVSANTADTLDLNLSMDLGNNESATQASGMVQGMLMPMMMMGAAQTLGPQAMNLSQKIKFAAEGSLLTISLNLTPEDVKFTPPQGGGGMGPGAGMEF